MSKVVVAKEVAEKEFADMCEFWEIDKSEVDQSIKAKLLTAIMRGRLTLNQETSEFSYVLRTPVNLENGETLSKVVLKEFDTEAVGMAAKGDNDFLSGLKMVSASSGVALGIIQRMKSKDSAVLAGAIGFLG
jgi:hypothetical protein